jgi:hypothetical protein
MGSIDTARSDARTEIRGARAVTILERLEALGRRLLVLTPGGLPLMVELSSHEQHRNLLGTVMLFGLVETHRDPRGGLSGACR